jgi:GT2 family glycosyltransferase
MDKAAVVILNWNGLDFLQRFLGIILKNSAKEGISIYVADNGSTDGSPDWIEKTYPGIRLLRLEKNHGFAGGYNRALHGVEAEYFVLLNSDIEVTPSWLEPMVSFMDQNRDVAACQPKIKSWHNRDHFEYAGAAGGYIDKYGYPFCRGRLFSYVEKDSGQYDTIRDVFWTSGACMIVRSDAWMKCSGFDDDFFAHMEEIDFCWRLRIAGYRLCIIPESVVYHVGGGVLPYNSPFKTFLNFRNNLFLLYKNLPETRMHRIMFIRKLLDGMAAILFLITGRFRHFVSVWRAHTEYYRNVKSLKIKRAMVDKLSTQRQTDLILNKSIVFEFYVKGTRTFERLKTNFPK